MESNIKIDLENRKWFIIAPLELIHWMIVDLNPLNLAEGWDHGLLDGTEVLDIERK